MAGRQTTGGVPELVSPMLVSTGSGQPPTGPDWVVELAWTGHRCVAYVEPGRRTRLLSANDVSMTASYPELGPPLERRSPPGGMVLDGTLVARGEEHARRPRLLKRRSGRSRPTEGHIRDVPVDFQVTDLLFLDGHRTVDLPFRDRRALLEGLGFDTAPVWATSPLPVSELATMLRIADAKGVDALHARHLGSRYRPGGRSPLWVKVPVPRVRQVVIGGWTPTDSRSPDMIAALLLGVPEGPGLRYVGRVGMAGEQRRQVAALRKLRQPDSPFVDDVPTDAARDAIWVAPRLVGLAEFTGWVAGGRIRLPHWRGLLDAANVDETRWARPPEPPPLRAAEPLPPPAPPAAPQHVETRRLEQHFVYNALNTIGALIRTDPTRARELLFGFADLSRAADQPGDTLSTLGCELDAVRVYLQLEQARFGTRLHIELDADAVSDPALGTIPVAPLRLLSVVRDLVQQQIEPCPDGGTLWVGVRASGDGCQVMVEARIPGTGTVPTVLRLGGDRAVAGSG